MSNATISTGQTPSPGKWMIYLAPDCTDSAVQKRVRGFRGLEIDLVSFSFRRARYNTNFVPDWPNVELGITAERRLFRRMFGSLAALCLIFKHRDTWRRASLVYARNLDLGLLGIVGKLLTRCDADLVYEVLDIHPVMTRRGVRGALARWMERRVLTRCRMLVVSSPAFLRHYFGPRQGFGGSAFVLENKWPRVQMSAFKRKLAYEPPGDTPVWTIGWFGNIRCPRSLEILTALADRFPRRVRIYIRGCASLLGEGKLASAIADRENVVFAGEYRAPEELAEIYSKVHFNWCVDLSDGMNSLWLLPNRLYEGGYFGVPAIAIASHETGRLVKERGLGVALETPVDEHLTDWLSGLTREDYEPMRRRIESLPATTFVEHDELTRLLQSVSRNVASGDVQPSIPQVQQEGVG